MGFEGGGRRGQQPVWKGMSARNISLITLTIQNSALILMLYYSRTMPLVNGHRYLASTAIFLNELIKLGISLTIALYEISRDAPSSTPASTLFSTLLTTTFSGDSWALALPATLYTLQNSLQYLAITHVEAATLQVTYQFKILPTAVFSVLLLHRPLSARKWAALALLLLGVVIVQLPLSPPASSSIPSPGQHWSLPRSLNFLRFNESPAPTHDHFPVKMKRSATYEGIAEDLAREHPPRNEALGLAAALLACTVSALGSVWFERIVKDGGGGGGGGAGSGVGIWVRNVQLSVWSLFPALFVGVVFVDGESIARYGFFAGYNWVVWGVVGCQALGGIVVSLCVYYADTLAKSFATSLSILLSLCLSMVFFEFTLTTNFLIGTSVVLYATYLYNSEEARQVRPPPIQISEAEKKEFDENSFRIKLPTTPFKETGMSTSTPNSPALHHKRSGSSRGYFGIGKKE